MSQLRPHRSAAAREPLSPPRPDATSAEPRRACGAVCAGCRLAATCRAATARKFTELFSQNLLLLTPSTLP